MGDIDTLVGLVPEWRDSQPTIEPLELGLTNRNYKVTLTDGRAYVVRLPGERTELLGVDRSGEVEASHRAAELGIGPPILRELPTVGTLITEFVPGVHADFTGDRLASVVKLLVTFHHSPPLARTFPIFRVVEQHAADAARNGVVPPPAYDALREPAQRIERVFAGSQPVPCHNDLLPANVLFDGTQARLLDFEYAGMNDAFFDLGNLSVNAAFDTAADEELLLHYFGSVTPEYRARLNLMKIMSEYREGMWGVVQQAISALPTDFAAYADERLANCLRLVNHDDFHQWLIDAGGPPSLPPPDVDDPPTTPWPVAAFAPPLPPPSAGSRLPPPDQFTTNAARAAFRKGFLFGLVVASVLICGFVMVSRNRSTSPTTATTTAQATSSIATAGAVIAATVGPWVIGNYPWYEREELTPANFPYDKVTHVAIGNAALASATTCCIAPVEDDSVAWNAFASDVIARAHGAHRPVLLQLGGAAGNPDQVWNRATATDDAAAVMAEQMVRYVRGAGYDGIEFDWEEQADFVRLAALTRGVRARWPEAVLTVDVAALQDTFAWAPALAASVDRINAMTYVSIGNWGGWDGPWHQGAMYENADHTPNGEHAFSVDRTVQALLAAGAPATKIGIGLGLFGTGYGDQTHDDTCPTGPVGWADEAGPWADDHDLSLGTIAHVYEPVMAKQVDPVALTPWLSAPAPGAGGVPGVAGVWPPKLCYISYEDEQSAAVKGRYIRDHHLGSIILWAVPQDKRLDGGFPVVDAVVRALRQ